MTTGIGGDGAGVEVVVDDNRVRIAPGERLAFGREPGPGQITADDRRVSGQHGVIAASASGWTVESTARFYGFTVYDCDSPSRLCVPVGGGPIVVPFASAVLAVELRGDRYVLEIRGPDTGRWADAWANAPRDLGEDPEVVTGDTVPVWAGTRWTDRTGRALRWYQTLVALCEPRFGVPPEERIPSNREVAQRLGVSQSVIENHYLQRLRKELGLRKFDEQTRLAAVVIAIGQGLVTRSDLGVLELPGDDQ